MTRAASDRRREVQQRIEEAVAACRGVPRATMRWSTVLGPMKIPIAAVFLLLTTSATATAELTVQGWLDFYDGKGRTPAQVNRLMAATYALGVADGLLAVRVMSCPKGYIPEAGVLAADTAKLLREFRDNPKWSVTAAVLGALNLAGCAEGPRGGAIQ